MNKPFGSSATRMAGSRDLPMYSRTIASVTQDCWARNRESGTERVLGPGIVWYPLRNTQAEGYTSNGQRIRSASLPHHVAYRATAPFTWLVRAVTGCHHIVWCRARSPRPWCARRHGRMRHELPTDTPPYPLLISTFHWRLPFLV